MEDEENVLPSEEAVDEKPQCKYIKEDGNRCKNVAQKNSDYCWIHEGGQINPEMKKLAKRGKGRGVFSHGLRSNKLQLMCNSRCFMYEECEVRTDTGEGFDLFDGVCFFELDAHTDEDKLLQLDGLKRFMIKHIITTTQRINRGIRYELSTGGYLSEPEISVMQRNVSSLGFNLLQIIEKEEMGELAEALDEIKKMYKDVQKK